MMQIYIFFTFEMRSRHYARDILINYDDTIFHLGTLRLRQRSREL